MFKHKELKYWSLNVQVKVSDKDNPAYVNVEEETCQLYVNAEKWRLTWRRPSHDLELHWKIKTQISLDDDSEDIR